MITLLADSSFQSGGIGWPDALVLTALLFSPVLALGVFLYFITKKRD